MSDEPALTFEDEEYARLGRRSRAFALFLVAISIFLLLAADTTNRLGLSRAGLVAHVVAHAFLLISASAVWTLVPADGLVHRSRRPLLVAWGLSVLAVFDVAHVAVFAVAGSTVIYSGGTLGHAAALRLPGRLGSLVYVGQGLVLALSLVLLSQPVQPTDVVSAIFATVAAVLLQRYDRMTARTDFEQRRTITQQAAALTAANAQLAEQNTRLVRLDQEKNEFLGIAAHDLKNPLNAIRGYTQMLLEEDVDDRERRETQGKVLRASERMFQLICNLLDVNAIERGEVKLTLTDVAFDQLVERALEPHRAGAAAKGQALVVEVAQPAVVRADASLAHQVIDNLISNAVKYSPPGKRITVRVRAGTHAARFEVQDEGPGLSAEDQAKLFGKFARLSAKPTGGEHSTGLGLSIVKRLVESMNGRVWCESAPGHGATFLLELPTVARVNDVTAPG